MTTPTEFIRTAMPLCALLGVEAAEASAERVVLTLEWRADLCTSGGLLHGGAVMALADAAGGACAYYNLPDGAVGTSTIESKTNFLGAITAGTVVATATPLHVGGTTIVIETEVRHGAGPTAGPTDGGLTDGPTGDRLVAKVTQTQAVLRPRSG
jgi:1,4-dihydroxy-2-naphthoyl-CoA hydrolase